MPNHSRDLCMLVLSKNPLQEDRQAPQAWTVLPWVLPLAWHLMSFTLTGPWKSEKEDSPKGPQRVGREGREGWGWAWSHTGYPGHLPPCPGLRVAWAFSHHLPSRIPSAPAHAQIYPAGPSEAHLGDAMGLHRGTAWVVRGNRGRKGHGRDSGPSKETTEVSWGGHDRSPHTRRLKQQRFLLSQFWRREA